jgi:hypothetical protein
MGYLRQSIAAVIALASVALLIPFVDAQVGTISSGTWQAGGATGAIAAGPAAAVLADGRILVAGHTSVTGTASATVAIYNPVTGTWTSAGSLLQARTGHTATTLTSGLVLIAGGKIPLAGGLFTVAGSFELFNPATGASTAVTGAGLAIPRSGHAAARLLDGRVLFVGGANNLGPLDIAEIYDPATNTVSQVSSQMLPGRSNLSATTLPDGRVLVAGGRDSAGSDLAIAQIFDPALGTFSAIPAMGTPRSGHTAVLLPANNNVLIFGGASNGASLSSAELYDSTTGWTPTAPMAVPRVGGFAAATPDGGAVAIGGGPTSAEFYRFVAMSSGSSGTTGGTGGGTSTPGGTSPSATAPATPGQLLDFPLTGHPSIPGSGGTFGYPFVELTNSVLDHVHQNELFGETTWSASTQTLTMKMYPQWITFASAPNWYQAGSLAQSTDENLAISPCNQPGTFTDINHNGVRDFWEDTNTNGVLDPGEDVNGNGILDLEPPIECGRFEIHAQVDGQGQLVGAGTDTDVLMRGHIIKEHFDSTLLQWITDSNLNGTLLTGRIVEFGSQNPSSDAVLSSFCPFGSSKQADGLCHAADGSTSTPMCQAGFTANADGNCHSPAGRFNFRVLVTGGLLVNPTGPGCIQPSCFVNIPGDVLDRNLDLGIDIQTANISGGFAGGAISGYASGTAGTIPRLSGLSPSTTTVTFEPGPYTYRGTPFTAAAVATGSGGLNVPVDVVMSGDCTNVTPGGCTATATFHGNATHAGSSATQTITIVPRPITFRADDVTRIYAETTPAFSYSVSAGSVIGADTFGTPIFTTGGGNVGSHSIALSGLSNPDYAVGFAPGTLTVTPRPLTVTALGEDKIYDGTTSVTVTLGDNRIIPTDIFTTSYVSASFADKNAGAAKTIQVTGISIAGIDAANYTVNTTTTTTADITPRSLVVSAAGVNKIYDGTTAATVTLNDNRVAGDILTTTYAAATFGDRNVGNGKAVSVTGISLGGADAGNYTANTSASTTANVTARPLAVSATGVNKVYDGTTAATVTLSDDRVAGDGITTSYASASFADAHAGTAKPVSVTGISITGTSAANYAANATATTTADITTRPLTVTATGVNKVYDGTTTATVTLSDNRLGTDPVTASYASANFADKHVGVAKAVTVTGITLTGAAAGNYTANTTATAMADVTVRPLAVTGAGVNKVYDGTTAATVTLSDNRVNGDIFTAAYTSAAFADRNAGNGKAVSVAGISISGTDAGNYSANTTASTTANITARPLVVSAAGISKVYDRTTTATVSLSDNRLAGDALTVTYASAAFADKNVGTGKTVSVIGIAVAGGAAGNYAANETAATSADITGRPLKVTATGVSKAYDGATTATVTLNDDRIAGDALSLSYASANFADKHVGTAKAVTVTGISAVGADAANYSANTTASTAANITARPLTIAATGVNRVYDGTATATVTLSDDRIAGDTLTTSYTAAAFGDKNAGNGKAVNVTGISISGTDAANYTANSSTSTTANVTARALTVTATGVNKVYDGTTAATVSLGDNRASGDLFTDAYTTAVFADKNVGTGKTVNVTGITITGTDAGNYTANTTAPTTANITAKPLIVTATGVNKVYDGTTAATVSLGDNRASGDLFTDAYTSAAFADKNVGTGKAVTVNGISISGTDAANYNANTSASASADITSKAASVTPNPASKTYGTADPILTGTLGGFVTGDGVTASYSRAAGETVAGGPYAIRATLAPAAVLGNYTITNNTAAFTITKANASVSATGGSFTYDGTAHAGTGSATGARGESLPVSLSYAGTGTTVYASTPTAPTNAGSYTVVASTTGDSNNSGATSTPAPLTIGKATATVTLSNLSKTFTGSAQSPTATTTPAGLAIDWTGAPQTNVGSYPVTATINDRNYQGSASGTFAITAVTATVTSTLAVSNLAPQYSDQDTFTVTVTSNVPGQPAAGVNFFVGSQQVGYPAPVTVPLIAVGDPATATTYKAVWTGQLLEPTPTGQMKPSLHIVSASFVNPNFTMANPANKSVNIAREDARIGGLDKTSYLLGGSATGVVPLTVTVKDITAMLGDAAYDAYGGDIRNAQVQFIDRATNTALGTVSVSTLIGPGTTTGTATLNWSVNLGTATSKNFTIGFTVLNYYMRSSTADNVVINVSK